MSDEQPVATTPPELSGLLGRDYWLILSTPVAGTGQADIDAQPAGMRLCLSGTHNWTLTPKSGDTLSGPAVLDGAAPAAPKAA